MERLDRGTLLRVRAGVFGSGSVVFEAAASAAFVLIGHKREHLSHTHGLESI